MMSVLIIIGIIVFIVLGLILYIKHYLFMSNLYFYFSACNVITFGVKGSGKDLLTEKVIKHRNEPHYSNIPYTHGKEEFIIKDFTEVKAPVDYRQLIENNFKREPHKFIEGADLYISDMGVYFPNYCDSLLYRLYPSMPVLYALDRQLYSQNIHFNSQSLDRGWKALREQADFFVYCVRTYHLPFILITKVITYDRYESAQKRLLPVKSRLLKKYSKAEVDIYNSQNGDIRQGLVFRLKKNITYDTRYFEKKLLKGKRKYFKP